MYTSKSQVLFDEELDYKLLRIVRISFKNDSTFIVNSICKQKTIYNLADCGLKKIDDFNVSQKQITNQNIIPTIKKNDLLSVSGNIQYNLNYQSYLDTPFVQNGFIQQFIQTRLNFIIKKQYPFSLIISHRNSNSPFFIDATDISVQVNQSNLIETKKKTIKNELEDKLMQIQKQDLMSNFFKLDSITQSNFLVNSSIENAIKQLLSFTDDSTKARFEALSKKYRNIKLKKTKLESLIDKRNPIQENIENKEEELRKQLFMEDSLNAKLKTRSPFEAYYKMQDSLKNNLQGNKKEFEKLGLQILEIEKQLLIIQKKSKDSIQNLIKKLGTVKNVSELESYLRLSNNDSNKLSTFQKFLYSLKQIGIGRSWIDYTDLTVKNISLNGLNIELNPRKLYFAGAIGTVNYRFRDFVLQSNNRNNLQQLALIRLGLGSKEKNNFIFTYYTGRKALLNQRGVADSQSIKMIKGFSLESNVIVDKHNTLIVEYARSTYAGIENKMFNLKDRTSEAWSIKLFSHYPKTNTRIDAFYRKIGENFQSFTLNPTNSNQEAFAIKIKQSLLKRKLLIDASIRKNDFNSPIAAPNFNNSSTFKAFQFSVQIPKYPFVSIGYYPSTQLMVGNNNLLYENQFNTLNSVISHTYKVLKLNMNSNLVFTKFYNTSTDTNFIYSNSVNLTVNQSIFKPPFVFQTIGSYIKQAQFAQISVEPIITYQHKDVISFTGGIKYNRIINKEAFWGATFGASILIRKIGVFELQYTKSTLPTFNNNLLPVDIGRFTYNKNF